MKNIIAKVWFGMAFLLALGGVVGTANAQINRQPRRVEAQTRNLVQRIRVQNDNFRASFDSAIQNVRLRGTDSMNINRFIEDYERAVDDFDNRFENRQATTADVQKVLDAASRVNGWLNNTRLGARVERDWSSVKTSLTQLAREYNLNWNGDSYSNYPGNNNGGGYGNDSGYGYNTRLTGTYRLDDARSENSADAAERAVRDVSYNRREEARRTLEARLETPDGLAIERSGQQISIASTRATRYTFTADGRTKYETGDNGANLRVRSTLTGERLEVMTSGNSGNDYTVTFEPTDNGRTLRVVRKLSADYLRYPVTVTSYYTRASDVAQLDIYERGIQDDDRYGRGDDRYGRGDNRFPRRDDDRFPRNDRRRGNGEFIVRDGVTLRATLNESLSTKNSQNNERFTMTVQTPDEYRGAIIEGYVSGLQRSGKVSGRAGMQFNFERIRLRDGRTYDFAGAVESIRNLNGDDIKIGTEGEVQGDNQGKQTATRGAVGAAVGAIIGAIAGGGKGAAIGAIIGAGAGAGSVYIEGREDLEINSGSDIYVRSSAPSNRFN